MKSMGYMMGRENGNAPHRGSGPDWDKGRRTGSEIAFELTTELVGTLIAHQGRSLIHPQPLGRQHIPGFVQTNFFDVLNGRGWRPLLGDLWALL